MPVIYGDNKPLQGSLLNNHDSMESKSFFFLVAHIEDTREPVMFATLEHLAS